jgi:S1-C subfamily serine protease
MSIDDSPVSGEPAGQPPYSSGSGGDPYRRSAADAPHGGNQGAGGYGGSNQGGSNQGGSNQGGSNQGAGGPYTGGPYGQGPYGQGPYGQGTPGQGPYGQGSYGQGTPSQGPYGQGSYGQGTPSQGPYGQGSYGQGTPGQGPYGQGPYAQGPYAQGPYAQGPYAQGPYAQGPYGYGGPAGPGGPYGYGPGGPQGPRSPVRRFRRGAAIVAVALAAGLGTFFALGGAGSSGTGPTLTTSQIEAQVDPALVDVVSTLGYEQAESLGTGLVLTSNGEIRTNNHVIEGATSIKVTDIGNGQTYSAKVIGYNQTKDIAVLQLQGASSLKTVKLGNSDTAAVGQKVVALGNAGGKGGTPSVATGEVTALNRSITATDQGAGTTEQLTGLINHNAPIQPGDSGGPLVNTAGQVIGIDTAASNSMQFQSEQSTDAFAIPINEALSIGNQIEMGHASSTVHIGLTGFLGVEVESAGNAAQQGVQAGSGAAVQGVLQGTPAANAGLSAGDVITSVDGHSVSSPSSLQAALELHHPGDKVTIGWTGESGQSQSAGVMLMNGPAA